MAEETRERSTTTAGLWPEAVVGDLNNDSCWLYLMKGLGSDRDKRVALGVLLAWIENNIDIGIFDEIEIRGDSSFPEVIITKNGITVAESATKTLNISSDEITIANSNKTYKMAIGSGARANRIVLLDGSNLANLMAQTFIGDLNGNVVGNVTGNVIGNVTGNVTGNVNGDVSTPKLRRVYSSASPVSYSVSSWPKSASDVTASITDSTVLRINDTASGTTKRFKLDWTPAVDTEVVVDFQTTGDAALMILNKDDNISTADGFVKQAPNTVRRYVYKGDTTGWVCLY